MTRTTIRQFLNTISERQKISICDLAKNVRTKRLYSDVSGCVPFVLRSYPIIRISAEPNSELTLFINTEDPENNHG